MVVGDSTAPLRSRMRLALYVLVVSVGIVLISTVSALLVSLKARSRPTVSSDIRVLPSNDNSVEQLQARDAEIQRRSTVESGDPELSLDELTLLLSGVRELDITPQMRSIILRHPEWGAQEGRLGAVVELALREPATVRNMGSSLRRAVLAVLAAFAAGIWLLLIVRRPEPPVYRIVLSIEKQDLALLSFEEIAVLILAGLFPLVIYWLKGIGLSNFVGRFWTLTVIFTFGFFSFTSWNLAQIQPGAFTEPLGKLDAVYFTATTMTTTGYGDIEPVTEAARHLITTEFVLTFLLVAVGFSLMLSSLRRPVKITYR
jgi:hypothetical protein